MTSVLPVPTATKAAVTEPQPPPGTQPDGCGLVCGAMAERSTAAAGARPNCQ